MIDPTMCADAMLKHVRHVLEGEWLREAMISKMKAY